MRRRASAYLIAYLLRFGPATPTPLSVPPPGAATSYTTVWAPAEFGVLDAVKSKFVLDDVDATRVSVYLVAFLLSLAGH